MTEETIIQQFTAFCEGKLTAEEWKKMDSRKYPNRGKNLRQKVFFENQTQGKFF
ncbi:hypothetical protein MIS45_06830 [Wielerella bovis]|uniref:hypothetical protein n=1 Tax=Wielerella bovis TaxID=2917790 RepID=UPI002018DB8D|nr:hypothetical protein [Wielerella bovis]ULJ68517.1 hypothetical protein MIS45_06830 [Wielerella bovis]